MPIVSLSNGQELDFPDEMTQDQIKQAISSNFDKNGNPINKSQLQSNNSSMFQPMMMNPSNYGGSHAGLAFDVMSAAIPFGNAAKLLPEAAPIVQSIAKYAGGIGQGAGTGAATGLVSSDNPIQGMESGAIGGGVLGAAAPLLSKAINPLVPKIADSLSNIKNIAAPQSAGKALLQTLGGGAKNMEENSTNLAADLMKAHDYHNDIAKSLFNPPLEELKDQPLYQKIDPLISTNMDKASDLIKDMDAKDLRVGPLYEKFKDNMTVGNAHKLQSEMGVMIGDLQSNPTPESRLLLGNLKTARDQIKNDLVDALSRQDAKDGGDRAARYQQGIDYFRDNVAPYLSSKPLREITREGVVTPKNPHKIFDTPTDIKNRYTGETETGPINKIIQDLPEQSKYRILFSKIGANQNEKNVDSLLDSLTKAQNKGFSSYFTPEIKQAMQDIAGKLRNKNVITKYVPAAAATVAGEELLRRKL